MFQAENISINSNNKMLNKTVELAFRKFCSNFLLKELQDLFLVWKVLWLWGLYDEDQDETWNVTPWDQDLSNFSLYKSENFSHLT